MAKNRWAYGERVTLVLSENQNGFQFASPVTELWAIKKNILFSKNLSFSGHISRTGFFPDVRFSPKCAQNCPLIISWISI